MENFPLYHREYKLKKDEIIRYVKLFKEHLVSFKLVKGKVLFSEHKFKDNLLIKIQWLISEDYNGKFEFKNVEELLFFMDIGTLTPVFGRVITASKKRKKISEQSKQRARDLFVEEVLKRELKKLTPVEYKKIEFQTKEKTSLPDSFFDDLQKYVSNNVSFERYCENKETQNH